MAEPVYRIVIGGAIAMIRAKGWRVIARGVENIPLNGPAVLASNHIGYLDFVFVGYAARPRKRLVRFMAKREVWDKKLVGWFMRKMRHIPVDRFGGAHESFDASVDKLKRGEIIGMFPEATISPSFVPRAGKSGAARMAQAAEAPLIPIAVWGTHRLLTKWRPKNFQRGVAILVNIGAPLPIVPEEDADATTARLMARIRELLAEAQQIYPQKPADDDDRWWVPAHLGGTAPTFEDAEARLKIESDERARKRATSD